MSSPPGARLLARSRELPPDVDLLDAYGPGGFFLERLGDGVAAAGAALPLSVDPGPGLLERAAAVVDEVLATVEAEGGSEAVVVGAVPFAENHLVSLAVPAWLVDGGSPRPVGVGAGLASVVGGSGEIRYRPEPPAEVFAAAVEAALDRIGHGELEKVVLARTLVAEAERPFDPCVTLARLRASEPGCFVYAAPTGPGRTLVGASPERLVRRRGAEVHASALGGTRPRGGTDAEDRQAAGDLLASAKDRREHALIVDGVMSALAPFCVRLWAPPQPSVVSTSGLWHLATEIRGRLREPSASALHLAAALHPTPAVCGTPVDAALRAIGDLEQFDRGFYAGVVGWVDGRGDGEWAVALRCAELEGGRARLYAGAGIVAGSDPQAEAAETEAKFGTMLAALGRG